MTTTWVLLQVRHFWPKQTLLPGCPTNAKFYWGSNTTFREGFWMKTSHLNHGIQILPTEVARYGPLGSWHFTTNGSPLRSWLQKCGEGSHVQKPPSPVLFTFRVLGLGCADESLNSWMNQNASHFPQIFSNQDYSMTHDLLIYGCFQKLGYPKLDCL